MPFSLWSPLGAAAAFPGAMDVSAIRALSKLVEDSSAEGLRGDGTEPSSSRARGDDGGARMTPASIGAGATTTRAGKGKKARGKNIWALDEVPTAAAAAEETLALEAEADDGRAEPEYEFLYKQAVTANDAYLGMGEKDPSSTQCEDLVLRVHLPGVKAASEVDLDVQPTFARLTSRQYRLFVYLPHPVDEKRGRATWDGGSARLSVTLPIVRSDEWG